MMDAKNKKSKMISLTTFESDSDNSKNDSEDDFKDKLSRLHTSYKPPSSSLVATLASLTFIDSHKSCLAIFSPSSGASPITFIDQLEYDFISFQFPKEEWFEYLICQIKDGIRGSWARRNLYLPGKSWRKVKPSYSSTSLQISISNC
ncbi:hypothetical protein QOT17_018777 [Balamuthia mandrillaris]